MRKVEIISLVLIVAAVAVVVALFQMDYGSGRKWMSLLAMALLALAIDPAGALRKLWKSDEPEPPVGTPNEDKDFIGMESLQPVGSRCQLLPETFLTFLDKESEDYYYIHYIDGRADEAYVGPNYLERQDSDELFEAYMTLDELWEAAANEEIEQLYTISADDFKSVRTRYQDRLVADYLTSIQQQPHPEPVNRVGRGLAYALVAAVFVTFCVGLSMLPFATDVDGGTYIGVFVFFCIVLLIAGLSYLSPQTWLQRRIKWLSGSARLEIESFGNDEGKWYCASDDDRHLTYGYNKGIKQFSLTQTTQIPLDNGREGLDRQRQMLTDWIADKPFIEHCDMMTKETLGICRFVFTISSEKATKKAIKLLREWVFRDDHDASRVCEYFKFQEQEGTFYVKYSNCRLAKLAFLHPDGAVEVLENDAEPLQNEAFSAEIKRFYADFNDFYALRMTPEQRIEARQLPTMLRELGIPIG